LGASPSDEAASIRRHLVVALPPVRCPGREGRRAPRSDVRDALDGRAAGVSKPAGWSRSAIPMRRPALAVKQNPVEKSTVSNESRPRPGPSSRLAKHGSTGSSTPGAQARRPDARRTDDRPVSIVPCSVTTPRSVSCDVDRQRGDPVSTVAPCRRAPAAYPA
jgi:hypothetical protein